MKLTLVLIGIGGVCQYELFRGWIGNIGVRGAARGMEKEPERHRSGVKREVHARVVREGLLVSKRREIASCAEGL